eukprot:CAMPEP_0181196508 /NCGR_PEP_ID=MMETSP1096-20121128/15507_1 /TAXON_ID=156174 ORGANISM="Chrysochromulina ericina, Strain CCMP281" /NCGR_SAMPLE_ID=MMETSP1096 /ASSEMBLY_ACC=CAM_ASM_000453 /LENGTH=284 /DNA_ID=CAMNT_0023286281 /DNA_START=49 /DNA_END=903 /DNA_ORIENTATION=+
MDKADELVAKARKRMASWGLFSSTNKYEDAAEMLEKAANLYKASKKWDEAGAIFQEVASCHLKLSSAHEAASAYSNAAQCYKKTNPDQAMMLYKEAVAIQIDLGRFSTAAKLQKEIGEIAESTSDLKMAMEAFQTAADYYAGEESHSSANQCLLKVAGHATELNEYKKAIEIYEQVAMSSLENTLLKWSVKGYLLSAGLCHLATGKVDAITKAVDRYEQLDVTFASCREGDFLRKLATCFESDDVDTFTDTVRAYDEITRLDPKQTTLLLTAKNKIKEAQEDIT